MNRPTRSLLDFGIVASVTVVPVLLGVLTVVGYWRPSDASRVSIGADRHISVRQVAALKTFEYAIVRRDRIAANPPDAHALLEALPQCRRDWANEGGLINTVRKKLSSSSEPTFMPATRIATQLAQLDAALARFSSGANRRVSDAVGFDAGRWFEAVRDALRTPAVSPDYPGRTFVVQCTDVASAVAALTRNDARMLATLAWRGTEVQPVVARWRPDQFVEIAPRQIARANPWIGLAGCVYMGRSHNADAHVGTPYFITEGRGAVERACGAPELHGVFNEAGEAVTPRPVVGEPTADLAPNDPRWSVPPSLFAMLRPLDTLRRPSGALYRLYTDPARSAQNELRPVALHPPTDAGANQRAESSQAGRAPHSGLANRVRVGGTLVDIGFSVDVTIDPALQALAQKTAACYTGRQDVCRDLALRRKEDEGKAIGHRLLEQAMVRMAAIAIIDVDSGRIEALAGALSPCTRQEYDGPGRALECDKRLPYPIHYRPDALLNPAVFHDAMPASVIKPIMAASFLTDPDVGARWLASERAERQRTAWPTRDSLRGQLMRSDSARFLDRMFCYDKAFANCARPWNVQAEASAFGWNAGCDDLRGECGKRDLLFGRALDAAFDNDPALAMVVTYGRLFVEPMRDDVAHGFRITPRVSFDPVKVRACSLGADGRRGTNDDWGKCRGGIVVDAVAEGWGQGNARSTALGVAGMMASLAAAANGTSPPTPHLVDGIRGVGSALGDVTREPWVQAVGEPGSNAQPVPTEVAEMILNALSYTHRGGTARLACEQVFDAKSCRDFDWLAGKTGTPTFPNDDVTLDELAQRCAPGMPRGRHEEASCGALRPYKWYVAAYRTDASNPRWTKVIGVLAERNFLSDTGRIHGAGDHGPNPAAEIALQIAGRHAGYLGASK